MKPWTPTRAARAHGTGPAPGAWAIRGASRLAALAVTGTAMALLATGCGGRQAVCEPDPSYYGRKDGKALEVPDDLSYPETSGRYVIPPTLTASREIDPVCSAFPPRIEGVEGEVERDRRRRRRAAERDREALAAATAASEATDGSAANPRQAPDPAPPPGQPVDPGSRLFARVYDAVAQWSRAWEERDFEAYLASYSPDFVPPPPMDRAQWERVREERMNGGARAITDMRTLAVYEVADGVVVRVAQAFAFESIESVIVKELEMQRERREWLIVAERVVGVE